MKHGESVRTSVAFGLTTLDYLDICRRVAGRDARLAQSMADTIRARLNGRLASEPAEYEHACRFGSEVRWFFITIVPNRGSHAGAASRKSI
jgi:hypothetical protein